jgi:hypothetical protein
MKKLLLIIASIILLLIGIMFILVKGNQKQMVPTPESKGTSFIATSTDIGTSTSGQSTTSPVSQGINLTNIIHNPGVSSDVNNPGYYFMGNTPTSTISGAEPTYVIVFQAKTHYFNISLLKEPIKDARLEAENYFKNMLGLTNDQMCALSYSVGVPQDVSDTYAGHDLKFSFCAGSTEIQ